MNNGDNWLANDKLLHLIACFLITILVSSLLDRARYKIIRRWSLLVGSFVSLSAGAAKEAADEVGVFWVSSGGSVKDLVADVVGVLIACLLVLVFRKRRSRKNKDVFERPTV